MSGLQEKMTSKGDSCLGGVSDWSAPEETTKIKIDSETKTCSY